jgi:hypothetical protein
MRLIPERAEAPWKESEEMVGETFSRHGTHQRRPSSDGSTNNGRRIQSSTEVRENSSCVFFSPVRQALSVQPLFWNSSTRATRFLA